MTNRCCQWKSMVAGGYHPDGHPEAERSGVEGSPVARKEPSERDWVLGAGDPSTAVGMTLRLERRQTCCCQW
ncbi:hypothetical protein [Ravibacter arvi]|uniref:hypothetical protein n=1 Tax=Ravibacter arvi TaxID=2051041 RepID=UPI0031EF6CDF